MYKILIEYQNGDQELRSFNGDENFQTIASVLWDERVDGALQVEVKIGGMVRIAGQLQVDSSKLAAYLAAKQAEKDAANTKATQIATFKQRVRALADQSDLTNADIKEAIFKYIKMKVLQGEL